MHQNLDVTELGHALIGDPPAFESLPKSLSPIEYSFVTFLMLLIFLVLVSLHVYGSRLGTVSPELDT